MDYGSPDGLGRFVESSSRCREAIERGQLIYAHTEAANYHCPKAKNLAHRLGRGDLLVNLDADNSNRGIRRVIERCYSDPNESTVLQMDEGTKGDPLRGTFGRICIPRYWFYRLGGYDESFLPTSVVGPAALLQLGTRWLKRHPIPAWKAGIRCGEPTRRPAAAI